MQSRITSLVRPHHVVAVLLILLFTSVGSKAGILLSREHVGSENFDQDGNISCLLVDDGYTNVLSAQDTTADSVSAPRTHMKLLPDHLSLMESALWGEHGLMRSTGIAPLVPETRKKELSARRFMLTAHQIGGFITMGLFIPTLIYGQKVMDMYGQIEAGTGSLDRNLRNTHSNFAMATWGMYMATASLSIFAPPPLIRRDDNGGTTTLHKTLAWVHFAGMIALPILGSLAGESRTGTSGKGYRTAHQIVAYTTAAAFTTSLIIMTF